MWDKIFIICKPISSKALRDPLNLKLTPRVDSKGLKTSENDSTTTAIHKDVLKMLLIFLNCEKKPLTSLSKPFKDDPEMTTIRLHDDSANDDSAIDKMAARF